jgi:hypothetical protein
MLVYMQTSYFSIWMDEAGKMKKLKWWTKTTGKTIPLPKWTEEQKTLKKFVWHEDLRPVDRYDIFRFYKGKTTPPPSPDGPETETELAPSPVEPEMLPAEADTPPAEIETEIETKTEPEVEPDPEPEPEPESVEEEPAESRLEKKENE